jgi:hypothetical protein
MHRCSVVSLVVVLFVGVAVGACGDDDSEDRSDGSDLSDGSEASEGAWPGDGGPVEVVELGAGLVAALPEGWEVGKIAEASDALPSGVPAGCTSLRGWLGPDDDRPPVELQLNSTGCGGLGPLDQIGNGYHGTYVSVDDVQDPTDVEEHQVTAGTLVTFGQEYFECTNECNDYDDHVGLLALTAPPDPAFPALTVLDPKGERSLDELVALADAISPA